MIQIYFALALLALGLIVGSILERAHYSRIKKRERALRDFPAMSLREVPRSGDVSRAAMRMGSVVISVDYFKRFAAGLKKLFGGEIHSYSSLLDRARREALLRLKDNCKDADLVVNLRFETCTLSNGSNSNIGSVEVVAYGTAVWYRNDQREDLPPPVPTATRF